MYEKYRYYTLDNSIYVQNRVFLYIFVSAFAFYKAQVVIYITIRDLCNFSLYYFRKLCPLLYLYSLKHEWY